MVGCMDGFSGSGSGRRFSGAQVLWFIASIGVSGCCGPSRRAKLTHEFPYLALSVFKES